MSFPLNKPQEEAVKHPSGPLLMAAGAGSGKTRALTSRLKYLIEQGARPEQIIAITFTNKAADQMRERVFGVGAPKPDGRLIQPGSPFIGTFHALGWRILKKEIEHTDHHRGFSVLDSDDSLSVVKRIAKALDLPKERFKPTALMSRISDIKSELQDVSFLSESEDPFLKTVARVYERYEAELKNNNAYDFDDLIEKVVRLFEQKPAVLSWYQNAFSHLLVDEYQDINTAQYRLLRLLANKHQNISVVGDDAQAIYSFRGADFRNFLNFERDWPNAKIVKLEQNYRSTKTIVDAASALIQNNTVQKPKTLWTENETGESITLVGAEDPDTESVWVASEIRAVLRKNPTASVAVLYRINAQSRPIEQALISENLGYRIFGGLKFYERKEIKDVVAGLKIVLNPLDTVNAERIEKSLGKRVGARVIGALRSMGDQGSIIDFINTFLKEGSYAEFLHDKFQNPQERIENIAELVNFATQFATLEEFLERVSLLQAADEPTGEKGRSPVVNLMSIHIAKGLEFDYVFVVGVNEGVLPHEKSMLKKEEIEEERRLLYVAMTRAREKLYILFHTFPSRFLHEIPNEYLEFVSPTGLMRELPDEDDMYLEQ